MKQFDFTPFFQDLDRFFSGQYKSELENEINKSMARPDGNMVRWRKEFEQLPDLELTDFDFNRRQVTIGKPLAENSGIRNNLEQMLRKFSPWRKGPYNIHGVNIDTEWRSDMKWNRIFPHIADVKGRKIADIGCGNGYHMFRLLGAGAELVIGADPSLLFLVQFMICKKYSGNLPVHLLPIGIESMPEMQCFDTVLSMGVLYHRKSPFDFLRRLKYLLKPGGELVLETLVIEGDRNTVLVPDDRYARMKNVWFIPSADAMIHWLNKSGFKNTRLVDVSRTTTEEQRSTEWMTFESLDLCLAPQDRNLTVEGYQAPTRATFIANR